MELEDFLIRSIIPRGMQIGEEYSHKHTEGRDDAAKPPLKFNLCTKLLRPEGNLTDDDVSRIGMFLCSHIMRTRPLPSAIAGVPNVGQALAGALKRRALVQEGTRFHCVTFQKRPDGTIGEVLDRDEYLSGDLWLIDDLVHRGISKFRFIDACKGAGYSIKHILVFLDYEQGAKEQLLNDHGIKVHSITSVREVLRLGRRERLISEANYHRAMEYLEKTKEMTAAL